MTSQPVHETPKAWPLSRPTTLKLEVDEAVYTPSGNCTSTVDDWLDSVKHMQGVKVESTCQNFSGPETPSSLASSSHTDSKPTFNYHVGSCRPNTLLYNAIEDNTHTHPTSTDEFRDLLRLHSKAVAQYAQDWTPDNAAGLEFAVFDTEDDVIYHSTSTTELLNDAIRRNEEHEEVEQQLETVQAQLIAKHKIEADGLRLSLHEKSELVAAVISERDEAMDERDQIMKERDLAILHRDDLAKQLDQYKTAREVDLYDKSVLQHHLASVTGVKDQLSNDIRWVKRTQREAERQCKEAVVLKDTAMKVKDKMKEERDAARQELEEVKAKKPMSREREEALRNVTLKLGEKKRRISAE